MSNLGRGKPGKERTLFIAGSIILVIFILAAVFAPLLAPYDPYVRAGAPFSSPDSSHLLGTNDMGHDILSELIYGSRISLMLGIAAALIATGIGSTLGIVAGYFRGKMEDLLMRFTDLILIIPFLPLVILLAAHIGAGFVSLVMVIGLITWPATARVIRSQVIKSSEKDYILSLKALGASSFYIFRKHLAWEIFPLAVYRFMLTASQAILIEASLSFLGLGSPLTKSWGTILYYAQVRNAFLTDAWLWWIIPPGLCIALLSASFLLLGYYFEARSNPRILGR